jgi:hypothetical protein
MTFVNDEPDPDDDSNYTEQPQYHRMSLESMDDVSTYFELTRNQARQLQFRLDDWLKTDRRFGIAALLKFDEYFEVGQYLDLYTEDDSEIAEADLDEGDKNKNYNLVFDHLMEDNDDYEQYVGNLPTEDGFFHVEYRSDPEQFHDEMGCSVKSEYIELERMDDHQYSSTPNYSELYGVFYKYIDERGWTIEPDGSLGVEGVEIISPPIDIADIESTIVKMRDFAEQEDFTTNDNCGLHINVSVPNFSHDNLDYLKLCLLVGDQHVLEKFGRDTNKYCRSSLDKTKAAFSQNSTDAKTELTTRIARHLQSTLEAQATIKFGILTRLVGGLTNKYSSIGIKDNRIEFRSVGGDWLSRDPNDVLEMVYRFTYCLYAACNPQVEKKEYAKKLYKFLQAQTEEKTAPMLSSLVISGEMNAKEALAKIKAKSVA